MTSFVFSNLESLLKGQSGPTPLCLMEGTPALLPGEIGHVSCQKVRYD